VAGEASSAVLPSCHRGFPRGNALGRPLCSRDASSAAYDAAVQAFSPVDSFPPDGQRIRARTNSTLANRKGGEGKGSSGATARTRAERTTAGADAEGSEHSGGGKSCWLRSVSGVRLGVSCQRNVDRSESANVSAGGPERVERGGAD